MKKLFIALCVAGLVGCSSSKKEVVDTTQSDASKTAQEAAETAKTATENAKDAIENAAKDLKDAAEDLKEKATAETQNASNTADFGEYTGTETSKLTCTNGDDVRTISVLDGADGGCGVVYNKNGETKTVAVAKYTKDHCTKVQDKMRANLEAPGFTCQ